VDLRSNDSFGSLINGLQDVKTLQFSIVTPSFRSSPWLQLCIPSVADQGVDLEHIVQDSCSDDGTFDWLTSDPRVKPFIEKDSGMYDAVNRGMKRATGEILAYLNCDEQYLPGALQAVWDHFHKHPETEILFANTVVIDANGEFLCYRKAEAPLLAYTLGAGALSTLTCSMFFRRSVIDRHGLFFDGRLRDLGDADWVLRALRKKLRMASLPRFTSAFAFTGANMNLGPNAIREKAEFRRLAPFWLRPFRPLIVAHHRVRRFLYGAYRQAPFSYSIYTQADRRARRTFQVPEPSHRWPTRRPWRIPLFSALPGGRKVDGA